TWSTRENRESLQERQQPGRSYPQGISHRGRRSRDPPQRQGDRARTAEAVVDVAIRESRQIHGRLHGGRAQSAAASKAATIVPMKVMLDTNICVDIIRERPQLVLDRFKTYDVGDIGISMVTLAELEYGVSASQRAAKNREALDQFVLPLEIVAFDRPATTAYGRLRAALEKKGQMSVR